MFLVGLEFALVILMLYGLVVLILVLDKKFKVGDTIKKWLNP